MRSAKRITVVTMSVVTWTWLFGFSAIPAQAQDVRWETIIGIIRQGGLNPANEPVAVANAVGSGTGAVQGGGQPWSTTGGEAQVDLLTGEIEFKVEGLVLAGGNSIGTRGGVAQVKGTLVCDTDGNAGGGNSTLVDTPLVPLSPQGDAEFSGNVGPLPAACINEPDIAFLIRIAPPANRWIAHGAVRTP